jgi:uncharacterized protein
MKPSKIRFNRREWMLLTGGALAASPGAAGQATPPSSPADAVLPDKLLLKDYRPKSIYKIPVSDIKKAKFPAIDVHYHARAKTPEDVDAIVKTMDAAGVERTVVFAGGTGAKFDEIYRLYSRFPKRFDVWCGFDMTGMNEPGFGPGAVKELERCHRVGAAGVGEIGDKGRGIGGVMPTGPVGWPGDSRNQAPRRGPHPDDPRMDALWDKCAQLGMPINLHMSDPYWSYLPQDKHNDGLMNGFSWRLDDKPDIMSHNDLIEALEKTLKRHPKTVFIACHFANLDYDLTRLGGMFVRNPNLYADISARFAETAPIPRFAAAFYKKYAHRLCYGTDMPYNQRIFSTTFRVLESQDEHFYEQDLYFNFDYHWPMHGLGLPDDVLKKVYRETALAAFAQARK